MKKTEQWKCATPAIDVDWHDWLDEAKRHYEYGVRMLDDDPHVAELSFAASWRCLLRWASRIEFFNED